MGAVNGKLNSAQKHLEAFEAWKIDHDAAMECYDLEEWLVEATFAFEVVVRADAAVRRSVYCNHLASDSELLGLCRRLYELWLRTATSNLSALEKYESMFGVVKHADEFRERIARSNQTIENWSEAPQAQAPAIHIWQVSHDDAAKLHALVKALPGSPGTSTREPEPMAAGDASLIR